MFVWQTLCTQDFIGQAKFTFGIDISGINGSTLSSFTEQYLVVTLCDWIHSAIGVYHWILKSYICCYWLELDMQALYLDNHCLESSFVISGQTRFISEEYLTLLNNKYLVILIEDYYYLEWTMFLNIIASSHFIVLDKHYISSSCYWTAISFTLQRSLEYLNDYLPSHTILGITCSWLSMFIYWSYLIVIGYILHLMIHQYHLELFVECSHGLYSSILRKYSIQQHGQVLCCIHYWTVIQSHDDHHSYGTLLHLLPTQPNSDGVTEGQRRRYRWPTVEKLVEIRLASCWQMGGRSSAQLMASCWRDTSLALRWPNVSITPG